MNIMRILLAMFGMLWIGNAFGASAYYCDPATGRTHSVYTDMCRIKAGDVVEYRHAKFYQSAHFSPVEVFLRDGIWMLGFYVERTDIEQNTETEIAYRTDGKNSKIRDWGDNFEFRKDIEYAENTAGRRDRAIKPLTAADIEILDDMLTNVPEVADRETANTACVVFPGGITKCMNSEHATAMQYVLEFARVSPK